MSRSTCELSVIVPALNEQDLIDSTLGRILEGSGLDEVQVIVADGGSTDRTASIARHCGAQVVRCRRGRAHQMNCGSSEARGEVVLYCHADTTLPFGYGRAIRRAFRRPDVVGGAFRPHYTSQSRLLKSVELALALPSHWLMFGDQAVFARRSALEEVGFYREIPIMEDVDLVHRLNMIGRLVRVRDSVITSARRLQERGIARQLLLDLYLLLAFHGGTPVETLAERYLNTSRDLPQ